MPVDSLEIENFRNLRHVQLNCSLQLNLIVGKNASGKTSLLEALYYLGRARSFRSRQIRQLICHDERSFRIVARMTSALSGRRIPVGIQRSPQELVIRIDSAPVHSLAELALQVPVLLLNPASHQLLEGGPQQRRRFMDWGLFHMDNRDKRFLSAWKRFAIALRHRNALLRSAGDKRNIDAWDEELAQAAASLDQLRESFCKALQAALAPLLEATLGQTRVAVDYRRGWPEGQNLVSVLHSAREQDRKQGHTRYGPQRADFVIKLDGHTASEYLSRGQQKLLIIALILAQAQLYRRHRATPCILLIDDLPAELDRDYRERVMTCLADIDSQLFISAIEPEALSSSAWPDARRFVIRAGNIAEVV